MKYNTEQFIEKAKQIHGDRYDYSKVEYNGYNEKVKIICPIHGEFWIRPSHHINKGRTNCRGCQECGDVERRKNTRKNTEQFIEKAKQIHGDRYDYSKVEYTHSMSGVTIVCKKHGEFVQTPNRHLAGHGCPICGGKLPMTKNAFIERAKKIHGDKYDYSKVEFTGNSTSKVCIICPEHGEFYQRANQHLQGRGCQYCKQSHLEKEVRMFLEEEKINFIAQKRFKWLGRQSLDFYLPDYNVAIECQGFQHFKPSDYFGGIERYEKTIELDEEKHKKCIDNNIEILYYTHYKFNYKYELIDNLISLKNKIYGAIPKNKHIIS